MALLLYVYWSQWITSTRFIRWTLILLSINAQLQVLALITVPELGTVSPPSVPNWLISPLKPRAQLCMEVTSDCDNHQSRVKVVVRIRVSKVWGRQCSGYGIKFWCSNLAWDNLITLLVWVDKENSIEFPFICCTLLIHILYLHLFVKSCMSPLSHSLSCPLIS